MKKITLLAVAFLGAVTAFAQTAREEIYNNIRLCGSNYLAYLTPEKPLTPAPKGYEPFYLSHYGRHGSRWLLSDGEYTNAIKPLQRAEANGKLSTLGKETLQKLMQFYPCTIKRWGDLTTVGERQHHEIGKRMTERFPQVFSGNADIDARSTVVRRCILSMTAECEEFAAFNPKARIHNDVSEVFQYYLNQDWDSRIRANDKKRWPIFDKYVKEYTHPERFCASLFSDPAYIRDSVNSVSFMRAMFNVVTNMQSHDTDIDLFHIFTKEECYDLWRIKNIEWYLGYAHAPQTESIMPFSQRNLLNNIIATADTIVSNPKFNGATLRFGHEVCVMPLACLLELDSCGRVVENLDRLDEQWVNYRIYPMGSNVQLVFYRPRKAKVVSEDQILVKALLNENEVTMPVKTDQYPYYKWSDLKKYYNDKLATYNE